MRNPVVQLDKDPINSLFFTYYRPTLLSLVSVTVHQIINGIILGRYVGKGGIAAVGLFGPILIVFIAFALALMIGGGILIARSIGAKDYSHAQQIFQFTTTLSLFVGGLVAFSSPVITGPITNFIVGDQGGDIVQSTYDYMFWGFLWLPFFFLRMLWGNFVNSDGAPNISRNASLLAVLLNIALDLLLIIAIPMGTAGASIATGLSIFAAVVYLFIYISRGKGHLSFKHFQFTVKLKEWKELFKFGVPSFVSEISFSLGLLLLNKSLVPFGALTVAVFGLINHLSFIFIRLFTAAMISALPIMSFNIGAGSPRRVLETLRFSLMFTFILGIVVSVVGFAFPDFLVSIFSGNESKDFNSIAIDALGYYFILFIAAGPNYIIGAYLQAIGKSTMSITLNLVKGFVLIGFFLIMFRHFGFGLNGIWLSRPLTEIGTLILIGGITIYYKSRFYSHEVILSKRG